MTDNNTEARPPAPHPLDALRAYVANREAISKADYTTEDAQVTSAYCEGLRSGGWDASRDMLALATEALAAVERERDEARAAAATEKRINESAYARSGEVASENRKLRAQAEADHAALRGLVAARFSSKGTEMADAWAAAKARLACAPPPVAPAPTTNGDKDRHEWTCLEHIADALRLPAEWGKMSLLMAVRDVVQHLRLLEGETMADASKRYVEIAEHHVEILDAAVDALDCDKYTRIASAAEELRAEACLPRLGDTVSSYSKPDEPGVVVRLLPNEQCEIAPGAAPGLVRVEDLSSLHVIERAGDGAAPPSERPPWLRRLDPHASYSSEEDFVSDFREQQAAGAAMKPERKAELRHYAKHLRAIALVGDIDSGAMLDEALDALDAAERRLSAFDTLAEQYDTEGDESSAETFARTLAGYGKALSAAREKLAAAERRAAELQAVADAARARLGFCECDWETTGHTGACLKLASALNALEMSGPWCACGKLYRRAGEDRCDWCLGEAEGAAAERARLVAVVRAQIDAVTGKNHESARVRAALRGALEAMGADEGGGWE